MKIFALLYTIETLFVFKYAVSVKIPKLILFELFICVCMRPKMRLLFICSLKLKANAVEFGQWLCGYRISKIFGETDGKKREKENQSNTQSWNK